MKFFQGNFISKPQSGASTARRPEAESLDFNRFLFRTILATRVQFFRCAKQPANNNPLVPIFLALWPVLAAASSII